MTNDNSTHPSLLAEVITAYAEATEPDERRLYLRAALRQLEADGSRLAEHLRLLVVASASEMK